MRGNITKAHLRPEFQSLPGQPDQGKAASMVNEDFMVAE
jgi:hypothetical protein